MYEASCLQDEASTMWRPPRRLSISTHIDTRSHISSRITPYITVPCSVCSTDVATPRRLCVFHGLSSVIQRIAPHACLVMYEFLRCLTASSWSNVQGSFPPALCLISFDRPATRTRVLPLLPATSISASSCPCFPSHTPSSMCPSADPTRVPSSVAAHSTG